MEKFFTVLIVLTSIALAAIIAFLIYSEINKKKKLAALNAGKKRDNSYVAKLLKINFPQSKLIRDAILPEPLENGTFGQAGADLISFSEGGIVVMSLCGISGAVDNPEHGTWTVTNPKFSQSFGDMIDMTAGSVNAIASILKEEHLYNIPIYNVAVFYGRKVVIRNISEKVLTSDGLVETLKDVNASKVLTANDIEAAYRAVKKNVSKN